MQIVVILHRAAERGCVLGPPKLSLFSKTILLTFPLKLASS